MVASYEFAASARFPRDNTSSVVFDPYAQYGSASCDFTMKIYPTAEYEKTYYTNKPGVYTTVVVLVFAFTALVFALYDWMVYRRQMKLLVTAQRTNAIVASLFPKDVQERIMAEAEEQAENEARAKRGGFGFAQKNQLKEFLDEGNDELGDAIFKTEPIADLFPNTTIMFADLVGFTAWSSMREPSQVFTLLETIYHEFDQIAKRRRVFKVETVGDCYVAVAGLPEPRKDHAVVMARFSRDCLYKMNGLTKSLEITLGPDTAELGLRFGLHSGPVTAGVLRGERARFQLFGDTVNTTARIETSGAKNKIHISQETGKCLQACLSIVVFDRD
jgi:class 3 adenylate cyclase